MLASYSPYFMSNVFLFYFNMIFVQLKANDMVTVIISNKRKPSDRQ